MRWLHLAVGVGGVVGFLGTGQYMDLAHDHLRGMDDARRLLFRSTHLYLLFGSLVNLALGLYLRPALGWRRWVRLVGSVLVVATSFLAAAGFFTEPWLSGVVIVLRTAGKELGESTRKEKEYAERSGKRVEIRDFPTT